MPETTTSYLQGVSECYLHHFQKYQSLLIADLEIQTGVPKFSEPYYYYFIKKFLLK
jgi:hypothetical protein